MATPGEIGRPGDDLPVPVGRQLRRWGALLALAGLALPGVSAGRERPAMFAMVGVSPSEPPGDAGASPGDAGIPAGDAGAPGTVAPGDLPSGDAGGGTAPEPAPWEAGLVEADGKPLPAAPPPGPVPVVGTPRPAVAAPEQPSPAPDGDLVPAEREYLRPILVRYAQENGLPADLVMSLAWVESSWRSGVVSDAGAVGVLQLMPVTADFVSKELLGLRSRLDLKHAASNVRMGTAYLHHLLHENEGNFRRALIAYNQGPTSVRDRGSYAAAERFADRVLALRAEFASAS